MNGPCVYSAVEGEVADIPYIQLTDGRDDIRYVLTDILPAASLHFWYT